MGCIHKFFGHDSHLPNQNGLLPSWIVKTLIIGTFNPSSFGVHKNDAEYFYGRSRNFLWRILPIFTTSQPISRLDIISQLNFLREHKIGFTDLLISINDAEIENDNHLKAINSFKDKDLAKFNDYTWNTPHIIEFLRDNEVSHVYFSKIGDSDIFSKQIRIIKNYCEKNGIYFNRLFTPSGQGLGSGKPRINKLINQWCHNNGAFNFPFLSTSFNINDFKWI